MQPTECHEALFYLLLLLGAREADQMPSTSLARLLSLE
jgi:hypothetical protein